MKSCRIVYIQSGAIIIPNLNISVIRSNTKKCYIQKLHGIEGGMLWHRHFYVDEGIEEISRLFRVFSMKCCAIVGIETTSANYRWRSSKVIEDGRTIIMCYFFRVMDQRGSKNLIVARSRPVFLCKWIVLKYCLCSINTRRVAKNVNIAAVCKISVNDC